jgi:hypothetical protein
VYRRTATLAAGLVLAAATASLLAPTRAEAACPTKLCLNTDAGGTVHLEVPPLSVVAFFYPEVAPYEDCKWDVVNVEFGDGSPKETYVWDGTKSFVGSHTFPSPGVYTVQINATQGHHQPSGEPCPDFPVTATVTYPVPPPPPKEKPPESSETPTGNGQRPGGSNGSGGSSTAEEEREPGPSHPNLIWRLCGSDVYAHRVACAKARRVVKGALEKLSGPGSARVAGFRCRLNPDQPRPISCRRGTSRILGPLV